jgi:hypothetical protein
MTKPLYPILHVLIPAAVVEGYLWIRGIKPSKRNGLWEHITWWLPKDEQTGRYVRHRFVAPIVVFPPTVLLLNFLFEGSNSLLYKLLVSRWW